MITEGYLARHHMGRRGMTGPALLDVAQDYALQYLRQQEVFDLGVVLKGGTSLRKFRAGNAGRFSTDLDFASPDVATGELVLDTLDGATIEGVTFGVTNRTALRGTLDIDTTLGRPNIPARIEVTPRPLWLPCDPLMPISLPVHGGYEFRLAALPAPALEEALAEKLAAWRRRRKIRDLYDLYWFGQGVLNEALVRRVLVLKVWHDVIDDGLGTGPFDPAAIVQDFDADKLPSEDIGLLTQPVEPSRWLAAVRERFAFVADLDQTEAKVARCNPGDRWKVQLLTDALPSLQI
ncbi:MAG: nucleotidyl transferase AbiEii/AbiGii toxin family protein [Gaiellales bacterium]